MKSNYTEYCACELRNKMQCDGFFPLGRIPVKPGAEKKVVFKQSYGGEERDAFYVFSHEPDYDELKFSAMYGFVGSRKPYTFSFIIREQESREVF